MPQATRRTCQLRTDIPFDDGDLRLLVSGVACGCAEATLPADAPLARALFHRVEVMNQSREMAAHTLGINEGDAAYLLTGLREDVARKLIILLKAGQTRGNNTNEKGAGNEQ